ncbi:MAG: thrombospondin type 3 repeat-containing protein, partial [Acidimicrobiia bacterium]|nr:thrombospondin type 3 repeat-containing protein [Acidimicrobiia bacterium]
GTLFWNTETAAWYCDTGTGGTNTFRRDADCWAPYAPIVKFTFGAWTPFQPFLDSFEDGTDVWLDFNSEWYGLATQTASGAGGIDAASGDFVALMTGDVDSGPTTRFLGYSDLWPGTWTAELAVYLDPAAWAAGTGFDYSVAANGSDNAHQRDFIFHVTKDTSTGDLLVGASNNTDWAPREDLDTLNHYTVTEAGWYTLRHTFTEVATTTDTLKVATGSLQGTMRLVDSDGTVLWQEIRTPGGDDVIANVGGNRYGWFTFISIGEELPTDNLQLCLGSACPAVPRYDDSDGDGVFDYEDNCPGIMNAEQADTDGDGIGDACDNDWDNDTIVNDVDNCPLVSNTNQTDWDGDGLGNRCDPDTDNDGVPNGEDAFPYNPNKGGLDTDGDGILDAVDNCPLVSNTNQTDNDGDGIGNQCDPDKDNDGVPNGEDAFPWNPYKW